MLLGSLSTAVIIVLVSVDIVICEVSTTSESASMFPIDSLDVDATIIGTPLPTVIVRVVLVPNWDNYSNVLSGLALIVRVCPINNASCHE